MAVIGGGITGLAAAHRLATLGREQALPLDLRVYEASCRPGGVIRTEREGDLVLETGPDSLVAQKPAGLELCRELGIEDEVLRLGQGAPTMQLFLDGRLVPLPRGYALVAPTRILPLLRSSILSPWGKARVLAERFLGPRPAPGGDESLRSFVTRRFGQEAFERVAEPILGGLFTADADRLSLRMALPRLLDLEQAHGSVTLGLTRSLRGSRAPRGFVTLRAGMERLVERLVENLGPGALRCGAAVDRIEAIESGWRVGAGSAPPWHAHAIVVACPGHAAAELLGSLDARMARGLAALHYATCVTVHLLYREEHVATPATSYGFFVPRTAGLPLLACNFMSVKFPDRVPAGHVLLRAFLGGATHPSVEGRDDRELAALAHGCLARILPLGQRPVLTRVHRFARSMPQFHVGYHAEVDAIEERAGSARGLFLCGSSTGSVGVPDCIASGRRAAQRAIAYAGQSRRLELAI